ncbi:hypothetical protein AMAG_11901 [Allomyces macrogynus ATCC 38327]|uniref:Uncharacterized protein n=1 Tax=Allomyces macrogynus (strain ATCC 38327) TaxID=578462 RepID=A0A0L0SYF4_ALLM3|nr:hypothetical protein AMAG_11901 [Allomyces macrogynus ATCC 38327]|eukprot:KNE67440.1 hypothetical protein AMAG_11901 [Allomyces macrogynus ATCC 38327]
MPAEASRGWIDLLGAIPAFVADAIFQAQRDPFLASVAHDSSPGWDHADSVTNPHQELCFNSKCVNPSMMFHDKVVLAPKPIRSASAGPSDWVDSLGRTLAAPMAQTTFSLLFLCIWVRATRTAPRRAAVAAAARAATPTPTWQVLARTHVPLLVTTVLVYFLAFAAHHDYFHLPSLYSSNYRVLLIDTPGTLTSLAPLLTLAVLARVLGYSSHASASALPTVRGYREIALATGVLAVWCSAGAEVVAQNSGLFEATRGGVTAAARAVTPWVIAVHSSRWTPPVLVLALYMIVSRVWARWRAAADAGHIVSELVPSWRSWTWHDSGDAAIILFALISAHAVADTRTSVTAAMVLTVSTALALAGLQNAAASGGLTAALSRSASRVGLSGMSRSPSRTVALAAVAAAIAEDVPRQPPPKPQPPREPLRVQPPTSSYPSTSPSPSPAPAPAPAPARRVSVASPTDTSSRTSPPLAEQVRHLPHAAEYARPPSPTMQRKILLDRIQRDAAPAWMQTIPPVGSPSAAASYPSATADRRGRASAGAAQGPGSPRTRAVSPQRQLLEEQLTVLADMNAREPLKVPAAYQRSPVPVGMGVGRMRSPVRGVGYQADLRSGAR